MNLLKSLRYGLVALCLAALPIAAQAEQRVLYAFSGHLKTPELPMVSALLAQGWRVVHLSSSTDANTHMTVAIFVLESPAPTPPPVSLDDTSTDDLFRIRKLTPEEIAREKAKIKEGK